MPGPARKGNPRRLADVQRPEHVGRQLVGTEEIRRSRAVAALGLRRDEAASNHDPSGRQTAPEGDSSAPGATVRSHDPARPSRRVEAQAGVVQRGGSRKESRGKTETLTMRTGFNAETQRFAEIRGGLLVLYPMNAPPNAEVALF